MWASYPKAAASGPRRPGVKEHSWRKIIEGGEGREGRRLARPPKEASLLVLRVRNDRGKLRAAAIVAGIGHKVISSSGWISRAFALRQSPIRSGRAGRSRFWRAATGVRAAATFLTATTTVVAAAAAVLAATTTAAARAASRRSGTTAATARRGSRRLENSSLRLSGWDGPTGRTTGNLRRWRGGSWGRCRPRDGRGRRRQRTARDHDAGPQVTLFSNGSLLALAKYAKVMAAAPEASLLGGVCIDLQDEVGAAPEALQLHRNKGGEGGVAIREVHFEMHCAIWAEEQGVTARSGTSDDAAVTAKHRCDVAMVKASRHPNHPHSGEGITRGPAIDKAATSRSPGDSFSEAAESQPVLGFPVREEFDHELGSDGSDKSGRQGARGHAEIVQ